MSALAYTIDYPVFQPCAYQAALDTATARAQHSFFDQHVIEDDETGYIALDEGDYGALPQSLIDRIVMTVPGAMSDDLDDVDYTRAGLIAAGIDLDFDAEECPF